MQSHDELANLRPPFETSSTRGGTGDAWINAMHEARAHPVTGDGTRDESSVVQNDLRARGVPTRFQERPLACVAFDGNYASVRREEVSLGRRDARNPRDVGSGAASAVLPIAAGTQRLRTGMPPVESVGPNTGDKLRSSNMLGFVCFIPLFGGSPRQRILRGTYTLRSLHSLRSRDIKLPTMSRARPRTPVSVRTTCHRHHSSRSACHSVGGAWALHAITTRLIGWLRKRVITPEAARQSAPATTKVRAHPPDILATLRRASAIARAPRAGMVTFMERIASCCCSTYAPADKFAGLWPSQMPNIAPTTKAATTRLADRIANCAMSNLACSQLSAEQQVGRPA